MSNVIKFYRMADEFGAFSNFSRHEVKYKGKVWKTSEHAFQAQKFPDNPEIQKQIQKASTPSLAARIGRDRSNPLRKDWESAKDQVMYDVLRAKFTQHQELYDLLLSTGYREIVEHTENDHYWADGGDGSGKNMLGILLMKLRQELRDQRDYSEASKHLAEQICKEIDDEILQKLQESHDGLTEIKYES